MGHGANTLIRFYDLGKLARHPAGGLVVRLAMAVNDITSSNTFLGWSRELPADHDLTKGLAMYAVRLQIAHTAEAGKVLKDVGKCQDLVRLNDRLPEEARRSFDRLGALLKDAPGSASSRARITDVRDKVTFHYDPCQVRQALQAIAAQAQPRHGKVTLGPDMNTCRIDLADRVLDDIVSCVIWSVEPSPEETYQQRVDEVVEWCHQVTMDFVGWAAHLCGAFVAEYCSAG